MNAGALIGAAGLLAVGAWWAYGRGAGGADDVLPSAPEWMDDAAGAVSGAVETVTDWIMPLNFSAMRAVSAADLADGNVRAMLRVIRAGEGTSGDNGYRKLFGGRLFEGFADHPRTVVTAGGYTSSAAGAYQFLASTWDETARVMGLRDFSPASQDRAAVGRIAARGALADVMAGRLSVALRKCSREWASLPGSPYGQPVMSADRAAAVFASAGGEAVA